MLRELIYEIKKKTTQEKMRKKLGSILSSPPPPPLNLGVFYGSHLSCFKASYYVSNSTCAWGHRFICYKAEVVGGGGGGEAEYIPKL